MNVLVLGDAISDHNIYSKATRLCPEAPVPVLVPEREESLAGGAGLVASNLRALGLDVELVTGSHSTKTDPFRRASTLVESG